MASVFVLAMLLIGVAAGCRTDEECVVCTGKCYWLAVGMDAFCLTEEPPSFDDAVIIKPGDTWRCPAAPSTTTTLKTTTRVTTELTPTAEPYISSSSSSPQSSSSSSPQSSSSSSIIITIIVIVVVIIFIIAAAAAAIIFIKKKRSMERPFPYVRYVDGEATIES